MSEPLAIVEFELAWAPRVLSTMDYTYRERHGEAIYRLKDGMLASDFFHRNVVLSFSMSPCSATATIRTPPTSGTSPISGLNND